jgi:hypothetical protein
MMNGLQMLESVDQRLCQAESEAAAAQGELDWLLSRRDYARAEEAAALRALAQIRLGSLRNGPADIQRLDETDAKVKMLMAQREAAIAAAKSELAAMDPALAAAELERERHAAALRTVEAGAERALADSRDAVLADPAWQAKRNTAEMAERVQEHAEQKAAFALKDSEEKGKPYLADPLFKYLWERHFGTPQYRVAFFVRLIDRWVARVARFEPARRDYATLTELPRQLADHALRMREAAEAATASVTDHARQIAGLPAIGEVAGLRQALDNAEAHLDTVKADTETVKARLAASTSGDDALTRDAVAALEAALGQTSLQSLRAAAARTPMIEDDAIVASLEQATAVRIEAEQMLVQRRAGVQAAQAQVQELRQIRQEMRQRGYGQSRWNFGDNAMVGLLLGELLRGALSRGSFWDRLNQQRMPDPWNQGTGGGILQAPRQSHPGSWNLPPMHNPWGQPGGPGTGGGFGGGGFRTGGRIGGGGGFKSGGSF